jgi:nitrogen fixation protein NifX
MGYKIAVGSTDGKVVNEHFGRCRRYLVFNVDEAAETYEFENFREVDPVCKDGEHAEADFDLILQTLSDCRAVLVSRIGPVAENHLRAKGLTAMENGGLIEDALKKIILYYKKQVHHTWQKN